MNLNFGFISFIFRHLSRYLAPFLCLLPKTQVMMAYFLMISGGVCVLLCPPLAGVLGYALFWVGLLKAPKHAFWKALIWGTLLLAVQLFWLATPEYHGGFIIVAYALICLLMGLMWAGFSHLVKKNMHPPLLLAAIWTLIEWARLHLLCGFAWDHAGMALGSTIWGRQLASVAGVLGLTFVVIYTNLLFLKHKRSWAVAAIAPYLFGFAHLAYHENKMQDAPKGKALLIQTGLLPEQKAPLHGRLDTFIDPLQQWKRVITDWAEVDWIVFPEAAFPYGANTPLFHQTHIDQLFETTDLVDQKWSHLDIAKHIAKTSNAEVIIGLDDYDEKGNYNRVFHLLPDGTTTTWDKKKLLPIAECMPFSFLKPLAARYGITEFFSPGDTQSLAGSKIPLTASVCYDECFSSVIRQPYAKLHINVTNDGWYPGTNLNRVHFRHARLRAIENGIPHLRACNTGVTAAIDSLGRTIAKLDTENPGYLKAEFPLYSYPTLFKHFGNAPLLALCFALLAIRVLVRLFPRFTRKSPVM